MTNEKMLGQELITRIENLVGADIASYRRVEGGYTSALRLLCQTTSLSFFAKIGVTPGTSESLRREIRIYNGLRGDFMPQLIAWEEPEAAPILILEDLSLQHWPPPWSERQVELTLAQIHALRLGSPVFSLRGRA